MTTACPSAARQRVRTPDFDNRHAATVHADRLDDAFEREVRHPAGLDDETGVARTELVEDRLVGRDEQGAEIGDVSSAGAELLGDSPSALARRGYVTFRDAWHVALDEERSAGLGHGTPLPSAGGALPDAARRSDAEDPRSAVGRVASGVPTCL